MRAKLSSGGCTEPANQPLALAPIYYEHANTSAVPKSAAQVDSTDPCANDDLSVTKPTFAMNPGTPSTTTDIAVDFAINATGHLVWTMNNSTFRINYNDPLLLLAKTGNTSYPYDPQFNVYNFGSNSSVRIHLKNLTPTSHPMHIHGHNM